jgi:hypothetical protein
MHEDEPRKSSRDAKHLIVGDEGADLKTAMWGDLLCYALRENHRKLGRRAEVDHWAVEGARETTCQSLIVKRSH